MGIGGINLWQLLILLLVIIIVFGTNKLRGIGADLSNAIKGFRNSMRDESESKNETKKNKSAEPQTENIGQVIDADAEAKDNLKN